MSGGTDDSNNIESSMNTDFIPELDHEEFVLQQQHDLGSPDVVSLSEGLSTSDGPTDMQYVNRSQLYAANQPFDSDKSRTIILQDYTITKLLDPQSF